MSRATSSFVMPALVAGIHDFSCGIQVVDGWAEPGHDAFASVNRPKGGHDALACVASYEVAP